jgi:putative RecB family exonuclease
MRGGVFKVSPLKLRVYLTCPLRYRYQYLDRLPPRLRPQDTVGTAVHLVLQQFFRLPPPERTPQRLLELFDQRWATLSPRYRRMPGVEELRERARRQLEEFAARQDLSAQPYLLEPYLEVPLAPDLVLFGRPDRIDQEADGSLHVIDYKTGEPPQEVDAAQLHLYAIMVQKGLGRPVARVSFWFLEGGQTWTEPVGAQALAEAEAQAVALAREMQAAATFPGRLGPHCAHCPFLHVCQHRGEIAQRRQAEGW